MICCIVLFKYQNIIVMIALKLTVFKVFKVKIFIYSKSIANINNKYINLGFVKINKKVTTH